MIKSASLCPFCNSGNLDCVQADERYFFVECMNCHATGPAMESSEKAIFVWELRNQVKDPEMRAKLMNATIKDRKRGG